MSLRSRIKDKFSVSIYMRSVAGLIRLVLARLIPTNPTTGTLGGINRATQPQWRTSAYVFAGGMD